MSRIGRTDSHHLCFLTGQGSANFHCSPRPAAMANLSQASEATLAKKVADMLAAPSMVYPNPVDTEIERRQFKTLEDRDNFFVLKSAVQAPATASAWLE